MRTSARAYQADFAAALLDPALPVPAGLKAWNGSDTAVRLAVHRNNVVSSLIDALADGFPVVQAQVGEEFFRAMASVFVRGCPPRSRVLAGYGDRFPDFVAGFGPARALPWLADLARLERARVRAYHAADVPPVDAHAIRTALAGGERIAGLRLELHPSVSVIESSHAVVSLWAAHQREEVPAAVEIDVAEAALVLRDGLDVLVLNLPPGAAAFISSLQRRRTLADAAGAALAGAQDFDLARTLALLLGHGALACVHLPDAHPT